MILKGIRDVLVNDAEVPALLSTYVFTTGGIGSPAVFTLPEVPEDAALPAVCIDGPIGGADWGTRAQRGAECIVDVNVWGDKDRSRQALELIAWKIWNALNRAKPVITGFEEVGCIASPPRSLYDPDGFPGYNVQLLLRILEV